MAPPRTRTSTSRAARPETSTTTPARHRGTVHATGIRADRPGYHLFDYVGAADAEDIIVGHGLRRRRVREETVNHLNAKGGKYGVLSAPVPALRGGQFLPPSPRASAHRGAGPHQGAWRAGRAPVQDVVAPTGRRASATWPSSAAATAWAPRNSPQHGKGRCTTT